MNFVCFETFWNAGCNYAHASQDVHEDVAEDLPVMVESGEHIPHLKMVSHVSCLTGILTTYSSYWIIKQVEADT